MIFTEQILYIKTSDIDSRNKEIYLNNKTSIVLKNLNFKTLLEMLPSKDFTQVNKKEIIAITAIKAITGNEILTTFLDETQNPAKLQLGETFKNTLIKRLSNEM